MKFHPEKLLIVDDNEMNRDMLARRLSKKGYEVRTAENACDIEDRIEREAVDLVLLDIEMPKVSGLEALGRIRKLYQTTQLPVIMVTARNQSEDIVHALEKSP